jgi:hypothetical protein
VRGNEALKIEFVHSGNADDEDAVGLLRALPGTERARRSAPGEACGQRADNGAAPDRFIGHEGPPRLVGRHANRANYRNDS